jgi:hypothetical protein
MLQFPTRADGRYGCAFGDSGALPDGKGPEMEKRHRVPVGSLDRQRPSAPWDRPGECHGAGGRREHRAAGHCADVDATVLAARVGIVAEIELSKHRPVHGPGPGECGLHADLEREEGRKQDHEALHRAAPSSLSVLETGRA